jgi:predicted secreted protein
MKGLFMCRRGGDAVRFLYIQALVLLLSSPCFSYELAQFRFIGFSDDGRYLAWEEYGIQDGTGYPYCTISIVDIAGDSVVAVESALFEYSEPDMTADQNIRTIFDKYLNDRENDYRYWEERAREISLPRIEGRIEALGIIPGNTGRIVVHHPMTDRTNYSSSIQFVSGWEGPWYKASPQFEIILEQEELPDTSDFQEFPFLNVMLTLRLVNTETRTATVLLDEISAGEASMESFTYGVRTVYIYQDALIAIVLYRYRNGIDGPDVHYRMVTGRLPYFEPTFWKSTGG